MCQCHIRGIIPVLFCSLMISGFFTNDSFCFFFYRFLLILFQSGVCWLRQLFPLFRVVSPQAAVVEGILGQQVALVQAYVSCRYGRQMAGLSSVIETGLAETLAFLREREMAYATTMLTNMVSGPRYFCYTLFKFIILLYYLFYCYNLIILLFHCN